MSRVNKFKIAISGIGGVGGYIGGLLAKRYEDSDEVEIYFIARGENETAIRRHGIKLLTVSGDFIAYPKLTTSDPSLIGPVDLLICCTKTYDLVENMRQCSPCIDTQTIIFPLLNGIDSREVIKEIYPDNVICDGCIYIVSRLVEPGVVKKSGGTGKVFFGSDDNSDMRLKSILEIFTKAGIDATLSEQIQQVVWEKFIFISPLATLTSYLDCPMGVIFSNPEKEQLMHSLLSEIKLVAERLRIPMPADILEITLEKMSKLSFESTSSMHTDFQLGKRTELESLTGYIVSAAHDFHLTVPAYEMMYAALQHKTHSPRS